MVRKEMSEILLECFAEKRTRVLSWEELSDYCYKHTLELKVPLLWPIDRNEILWLIFRGIEELQAAGKITVARHKGYINTIELTDAVPVLR